MLATALNQVEQPDVLKDFIAKLEQAEKVSMKKHKAMFDILNGLPPKKLKVMAQYCGLDPTFYKGKPALIVAVLRGMSLEFLPEACHDFK